MDVLREDMQVVKEEDAEDSKPEDKDHHIMFYYILAR